jgi:hypothetical protein
VAEISPAEKNNAGLFRQGVVLASKGWCLYQCPKFIGLWVYSVILGRKGVVKFSSKAKISILDQKVT